MLLFKMLNKEKRSKDMLVLTSLTFLVLSASLRGEECVEPCQCCRASKCSTGQEKCQGCIDGFSGEKCNIPCPANCINCSQKFFESEKVCPVCKDGFYNGRFQDEPSHTFQENCALSCKAGCGKCASFDKCLECMEGYFVTSGQECFAYLDNCKKCNDEMTCINCTESSYWDGQTRRCQHCKFRCKACKTYDICFQCENGYFVEDNGCKPCHNGCMSCEKFDSCRNCNRGFYKINDQCVTCKSHCSDCRYSTQTSYTCNSCDYGHFLFNDTCYESCGQGCAECLTNTQCNICKKEYFKLDVRCVKCPGKCLSCSSEKNCTQCISGYHGYDCSLQCPGKCKECYMVSGTCLACHEGYFLGDSKVCERCPLHCIDCLFPNECLVCKPGHKGRTCSEKCDNCRNGTKCDKSTGYCQDDCHDGLSGTNCNVSCSAKCLKCERQNKNKCKICASNWFGPECSSQCPFHCKSNACVTDGRSTLGCKDGYYGSQCDKNCSNLCERNVCDTDDGKCTHGCVSNCTDNCVCFKNCRCGSNDTCDGCKNGFFGGICENECSVGCIDQVCSRYTGICSNGCKSGFKGITCIEVSGFSFWMSRVLPIAASVLVPIVLIALIVYCITRKRRRQRRQQKRCSPTPHPPGVETEDDLNYTDIQDNLMEPKPARTYTPLLDMPLSQDGASRDYRKLEPANDSLL